MQPFDSISQLCSIPISFIEIIGIVYLALHYLDCILLGLVEAVVLVVLVEMDSMLVEGFVLVEAVALVEVAVSVECLWWLIWLPYVG